MTLTDVLVGGRKPEEIQQEFLQKKARDEARIKAEAERRAAEGQSRTANRRNSGRGAARSSRRAPFHIQEFGDFYRIGTLRQGDELITYDIGKTLLAGGRKEPQTEWLKLDFKAQCEEDPPVAFIGTAETYMRIFGLLYDNRSDKQHKGMVEHVRANLEKILVQTPIMTLTSVVYTGKDDEVDRVLLGGGDQGVFPIGQLTGPCGPFRSLSDVDSASTALLRMKSPRAIAIGRWLTGYAPYLSRPSFPLSFGEVTYPVSLGVFEDDEDLNHFFHVDANQDPLLPALGIRVDIQEAPEARR